MKKYLLITFVSSIIFLFISNNIFADDLKNDVWLYTQTSESQKLMTADKALQLLKEGNQRFVSGLSKNRDLLQQSKLTGKKGQYPFAIVLSCMDSRGSPELLFDQGIGDIFAVRLAGNVLDQDQLGGMEYATEAVGSHLIVVMGHSRCGAVSGACHRVEMGYLTQLLNKIQPAIDQVMKTKNVTHLNCEDQNTIDEIAKQNVLNVMSDITKQSPIINKLVQSGDVKIVGGMQDVQTGKITFF